MSNLPIKTNRFPIVRTVSSRITATIPLEGVDEFAKLQFTAKFKKVDVPAIEAMQRRGLTDTQYLDELLLSISDLVDESDVPIAEAEQIALVKREPALRRPTIARFFSLHDGIEAKN